MISEEQEYIRIQEMAYRESLGTLPWDLERFRSLPRLIQRKILEQVFTPNIAFCNDFLEAVAKGGFHRINFKQAKFFTIKQKQIHLEEDI